MFREVELKVKLDQPEKVRDWLENKAVFKGQSQHLEYYFDHPSSSFIFQNPEDGTKDSDKWLRVRITDTKHSLCFKQWYRDENGISSHCDEYETDVKDGNTVKALLKLLGFSNSVTIQKTRKSYRFDDLAIELDSVDGLGDFMEVEYQGKPCLPEEARRKIIQFIDSLGSPWKRAKRGYGWMLWNPDSEHFY